MGESPRRIQYGLSYAAEPCVLAHARETRAQSHGWCAMDRGLKPCGSLRCCGRDVREGGHLCPGGVCQPTCQLGPLGLLRCPSSGAPLDAAGFVPPCTAAWRVARHVVWTSPPAAALLSPVQLRRRAFGTGAREASPVSDERSEIRQRATRIAGAGPRICTDQGADVTRIRSCAERATMSRSGSAATCAARRRSVKRSSRDEERSAADGDRSRSDV